MNTQYNLDFSEEIISQNLNQNMSEVKEELDKIKQFIQDIKVNCD